MKDHLDKIKSLRSAIRYNKVHPKYGLVDLCDLLIDLLEDESKRLSDLRNGKACTHENAKESASDEDIIFCPDCKLYDYERNGPPRKYAYGGKSI